MSEERLRRSRGFVLEDTPGGRTECETFTCCHCNRPVVVPRKAPPEQVGGICYQCYAMICPECVKTGKCTPFLKKLDAYEKRQVLLRSVFVSDDPLTSDLKRMNL